jgi:uncharacterized phiE125 gp8 family phage protein
MIRSKHATKSDPLVEPVTPSEVAEYLRVDYEDHDTLLANYAKEARQVLEQDYLWKASTNATCVDKFSRFGELELHWQPVQSITSITYLDSDNATQTLSTDIYELATVRGVGYVRLKYDQDWPSSLLDHPDSITVTYTAGYGATASAVPEAIRQGIIMYAGHLYDNPTDPPPSWVLQRVGGYADARALG